MFGLLKRDSHSALGSLSVVDSDVKPLRRVRACVACRDRKLKCSLARPQCNRCEAQGTTCHYPEPRGSTATASAASSALSSSSIRPSPISTTATTANSSNKASKSTSLEGSTAKRKKRAKVTPTSSSAGSDTPLSNLKKAQTTTKNHHDRADNDATTKEENPSRSASCSKASSPPPAPPFTALSAVAALKDEDGHHHDHHIAMDDGSWMNHLLLLSGDSTEMDANDVSILGTTPPTWFSIPDGINTDTASGESTTISTPGHQQPDSFNHAMPWMMPPLDTALHGAGEADGMEVGFSDSPKMLQSPYHYSADLDYSGDYMDLLVMPNIISSSAEDDERFTWGWDQGSNINHDLVTAPAGAMKSESLDGTVSMASPSKTAILGSPYPSSSSSDSSSPSWSSPLWSPPLSTTEFSFPPTATTTSTSVSTTPSAMLSPTTTTTYVAPQTTPKDCSSNCLPSVLTCFENIQVESLHARQPHEVLQSQKQAMAACGLLLECAACSRRSDLVMMVISLCSVLVGSLERMMATGTGTGMTTGRENGSEKNRKKKNKGGGDRYATIRRAEENEVLDVGNKYDEEEDDNGGKKRNRHHRQHRHHNHHHHHKSFSLGTWTLNDEEDMAQIVRTLAASRTAKLDAILKMVGRLAGGMDWASHAGLVRILRGRLKKVKGVLE